MKEILGKLMGLWVFVEGCARIARTTFNEAIPD
jgi:hypothetical protein